MKFSEFVFHYVQLLCYKCHKINPSRGGLYIASKKDILFIFQNTIPIVKHKLFS